MAASKHDGVIRLGGDRKAALDALARLGWRVQTRDKSHHRIVDATTGTLVAGLWSDPDGYGLTAEQVETIIAAHR